MMARRNLNLLLSEAGHTWLERLAEEYGLTKSAVARATFVVATSNEKAVRTLLKELKEQP